MLLVDQCREYYNEDDTPEVWRAILFDTSLVGARLSRPDEGFIEHPAVLWRRIYTNAVRLGVHLEKAGFVRSVEDELISMSGGESGGEN